MGESFHATCYSGGVGWSGVGILALGHCENADKLRSSGVAIFMFWNLGACIKT